MKRYHLKDPVIALSFLISQVVALERGREQEEACGEIETEHPGYLGSQDTFYVGTLKGVGRICQQTFVDTKSKTVQCKLYPMKTALTAADMLNDQVLPFYEEHGIELQRVLTDRGSEYCGKADEHEYSNYKHEPNRRFVSTFELLPLADCPLSKIGEAVL